MVARLSIAVLLVSAMLAAPSLAFASCRPLPADTRINARPMAEVGAWLTPDREEFEIRGFRLSSDYSGLSGSSFAWEGLEKAGNFHWNGESSAEKVFRRIAPSAISCDLGRAIILPNGQAPPTWDGYRLNPSYGLPPDITVWTSLSHEPQTMVARETPAGRIVLARGAFHAMHVLPPHAPGADDELVIQVANGSDILLFLLTLKAA